MVKTSSYWDKRALRRLTSAEKTSDEYIKRVKKMYDKAYRDLDKQIETIYKNYSKDTGIDVDTLKQLLTKKETSKVFKDLKAKGLDKYIKNNYKSRITRLEQIKAQVYSQAKGVYTEEELINHNCYKDVYKNSYYKTVYDTQLGTGYDFSFNKIDDNMLNSILKERWSGKNYSQRIWGNTDILAESVSEIIGAGLMSGQSIAKMSKQIRDRYGVSKYYAERLIRTETNHFNNEADAMAYEDMGVEEYVFVAVLDSRTSPMCQDHDNKRYKFKDKQEGVNFPPLHPNCRSTTRGYVGEEAEKLLKRRARDPVTGKTELIDNMSYKEWAKSKGLVTDTPKPNSKTKNTVVIPKTSNSKTVNTVSKATRTTKPKGGTDMLNALKRSYDAGTIEYKPVRNLETKLDTDNIVRKLAGGDKTQGSCASLSWAYAGNKAGLDVTDYRGGVSRSYFSRRANTHSFLKDSGIKYFSASNKNDFKAVYELLDETYKDTEYIIFTGNHASVIRNSSTNGWEYLELQSSNRNGYLKLDNEVLKRRFGCKKSHSSYGDKYEVTSYMVKVDDLKKAKGFKEMLGYINTNTDNQLKGVGGFEK